MRSSPWAGKRIADRGKICWVPNPPRGLIDELSNERHVTPGNPPCFIFATDADTAVPVENSMEFAAALRKARVHFELHIYERGATAWAWAASLTTPDAALDQRMPALAESRGLAGSLREADYWFAAGG